MKNIRKIASLLLALFVVLSMMSAAFADDMDTGSIHISGIAEKTKYSVYQMLDLDSYSTSVGNNGGYSYTIAPGWEEFVRTAADAKGVKYFSVDSEGYVTWNGSDDDERVAKFAQEALAYAQLKHLNPVQSSHDEDGNLLDMVVTGDTGVFSNLKLGYYLVDSNLGVLCGLTTTNPNGYITAKNAHPSITKKVYQKISDQWVESTNASIGERVSFRTTITVHAGAQNFVLHDKMSEGLTLVPASFKLSHVPFDTAMAPHDVDAGYYTILLRDELTGDNAAMRDTECDFEIVFTQEFCDTVSTNDRVVVYYDAILNENAFNKGETDAEGNALSNINETWLNYGEGHETTHDTAEVFTYGFEIVKTDIYGELLDGAEFKLYDAATEGNVIKVVWDQNRGCYRIAEADDENATETIVVKGGLVRVIGLGNVICYLEETKNPAGYNRLETRKVITISDANQYATFTPDEAGKLNYNEGSGVHVINKTGSILPHTGGIGTTLFYVIGGVLVAAAVVLLVTRKRMNEK